MEYAVGGAFTGCFTTAVEGCVGGAAVGGFGGALGGLAVEAYKEATGWHAPIEVKGKQCEQQ